MGDAAAGRCFKYNYNSYNKMRAPTPTAFYSYLQGYQGGPIESVRISDQEAVPTFLLTWPAWFRRHVRPVASINSSGLLLLLQQSCHQAHQGVVFKRYHRLLMGQFTRPRLHLFGIIFEMFFLFFRKFYFWYRSSLDL